MFNLLGYYGTRNSIFYASANIYLCLLFMLFFEVLNLNTINKLNLKVARIYLKVRVESNGNFKIDNTKKFISESLGIRGASNKDIVKNVNSRRRPVGTTGSSLAIGFFNE